ncbi:GNAT family N-acetyltransferase [Denitromonas iodatirespirans]|uniref:GNAT family N-acetyltransferase n=1 Tax=Denitromonas iodatirespirans TaxID=2795389 RepID=A0A944DAP0_DENI1|nr:GNAT family N-acetyltransferase [Denitromonas iodatirespirans]MBT0962870.1 GNAT family N-acetyltransferase [Denitromonas iodatirespirans]
MTLTLIRLSEARLSDLIALHNDPSVLRHMPLAGAAFDEATCRRWVEDKERQWAQNGYGPWGVLVDGEFAGWGGFQQEQGDADLALVLSARHWGHGRAIYQVFIKMAFEDMGLASITALLPPSRRRANGLLRLGFEADGSVQIAGSVFNRYRLWAPAQGR